MTMAIASRWPFSDQMETLNGKGVSVMGLSMESLVGALAGGYSGRSARGRCAAVARLRAGAEVGRGSPRPRSGTARYRGQVLEVGLRVVGAIVSASYSEGYR